MVLAKNVHYINATLEAGDCIYVPAYYYIESKTLSNEGKGPSLILAQQYESHSKLVDMVLDGIQDNSLTDDENYKHKYDKMLEGYLSNII